MIGDGEEGDERERRRRREREEGGGEREGGRRRRERDRKEEGEEEGEFIQNRTRAGARLQTRWDQHAVAQAEEFRVRLIKP